MSLNAPAWLIWECLLCKIDTGLGCFYIFTQELCKDSEPSSQAAVPAVVPVAVYPCLVEGKSQSYNTKPGLHWKGSDIHLLALSEADFWVGSLSAGETDNSSALQKWFNPFHWLLRRNPGCEGHHLRSGRWKIKLEIVGSLQHRRSPRSSKGTSISRNLAAAKKSSQKH